MLTGRTFKPITHTFDTGKEFKIKMQLSRNDTFSSYAFQPFGSLQATCLEPKWQRKIIKENVISKWVTFEGK